MADVPHPALKWVKTAVLAALGGGFAAALVAGMDPAKYSFPRDLGSGKLWPFFFQGAGLLFLGLLMKSPLGQKAMTAYKESQEQIAENKQALEQAKADLKAVPAKAAVPPAADPDPAGGPPTGPPGRPQAP